VKFGIVDGCLIVEDGLLACPKRVLRATYKSRVKM
jgi:hypothetical protein